MVDDDFCGEWECEEMGLSGTRENSPKDLALEIHEFLKTRNKTYYPRPFNRFNIEKSMCWLIPSNQFPAYKFGKFVVFQENGFFNVGIHVEKGLGTMTNNKPELTMDETWVWNDFIQALASGDVGSRLEAIQQDVGESAEVSIHVDVPDLKTERKFGFKDGVWTEEGTDIPSDIRAIPAWIDSIPQNEWFWVDLFVTFRLSKETNVGQDDWSAYDVVRRLLEPLEQWVR